MALPKEPRQKMINMMYLVLTALLALNVSSEVLNAFQTVETSITNSNNVIGDKNKLTYESFAEKLKDQQTTAKAAVWSPKADQVKKLSADLYAYIEKLKEDLKVKAGIYEKDGVKHFNIDNLDAATVLMDKEGKGKELYDKLGAYKQQAIGVLKPEEFADNPKFQADLKKDIEKFQKSIPINLTVPKSNTGTERANNAEGWTQNYFHMTPAIAAMTILSKFQNDIKSTESQLIDYCHNQIGTVKLVYDKFQAIAQSNTSYAMPGDPIEITAGVGAFSDAAKPKITINGNPQNLTADGTALFKTTASGTGDHNVNVTIEFNKPDGSVEKVSKVVKYTVGVPSGASVFLEKMNVMYVGVDNPITISGGSVGSEKVKVSFPGGTISKVSGDRYVAKPANPGMSKIVVNANGKNFDFEMRLKFLPPATAFIGSKKSGTIPAAELKAIGAVIAKLEDSEFQAPYRVVSYKVSAVGGGIQVYSEAVNTGNRWSGQAATLIGRAGPGSTVFFDEITVVGPDGRQRQISPMKFNLR